MSFNIHINNICNKAYLIIYRLFRCFITNNYIYLLKAYILYVRRTLYVLWLNLILLFGIHFHCISLILITLKIFKNISLNDYLLDVIFPNVLIYKNRYTYRLIFLNIKTLSLRRLVTDLVLTYKIQNGFVDVDPDKIFDVYSNICRGPAQKIRNILCRTNTRLNNFSNRVSIEWNSLPINVTSRNSIVGVRDVLKRTTYVIDFISFLKYIIIIHISLFVFMFSYK